MRRRGLNPPATSNPRPSLADRVAAAVDARPVELAELDGGTIGSVHRVELDDGRTVAAKTGDTPLETEAFMLRYLASESDLSVPEVLHAAADLLVLAFVAGESAFSPAAERDAAPRPRVLLRPPGGGTRVRRLDRHLRRGVLRPLPGVAGHRPGFFDRRRFAYQLYPLLVHAHLFGGRYPGALGETLERLGY